MSISLQKGQKISLKNENGAGLTKIMVGLGWSPNNQFELKQIVKTGRSIINKLMGKKEKVVKISTEPIDCDSSVFMIDQNGKLKETIFYGKRRSSCDSIIHKGDDLTGNGIGVKGDNEQIDIDLSKIPSNITKLVILVNIYACQSREQDFGMVSNCYTRIVADNIEVCRYNLSNNYDGKTALLVGEVYKKDNEWRFNALGESTTDVSIEQVARRYN